MKRHTSLIIQFLATIFFASAAVRTLSAQASLPMTVNVPFPFTVDTQRMASGTYQLSLVPDSFLLSIVDMKNGHRELFAILHGHQSASGPQGRLLFQATGGLKQLDEMYFPGTATWIEIAQRHSAESSTDHYRSAAVLTLQSRR